MRRSPVRTREAAPRIKMVSFKCLNCSKNKIWHRNNTNKYCDNKCQKEYEYRVRIDEWLISGHFSNVNMPKWIVRYLSEQFGYKCSVCGISEYCNKPLVLEVDHVDGNHTNNTKDNLRLICPNCHSQTSTYKNRNKGNGRTNRKVKFK
jgi:Zn finger protein HypA/HybF involved in hydrogenase expression